MMIRQVSNRLMIKVVNNTAVAVVIMDDYKGDFYIDA